ncbi:MAG: endonuclease III domain-containing protein [candidate division NC10 bacterium]|nr:endonuclease III domain-containing protein [candidate division NC10 bacterium]MBI2454804.1 endonuclease III domain-containing protein [candidate division NC10 bacterium]MBI3120991.1 endonuclease III domain-containing protein [candidate division NC10 bacterium]
MPIRARHRSRPQRNSGPLSARLRAMYRAMLRALGPQGWWPGRNRFEVIIGAILTQNTAWTNVARAIGNLRRARVLTPEALAALPAPQLARLIRPSGYYKTKAARVKRFLRFLRARYALNLSRMFARHPSTLREELLAVSGIGPETADSILLYAGGVPVLVVDAYTRRILGRHGLIRPDATYDRVQALFLENLPPETALYNEYHALLVAVGKDFCRPVPRCSGCPLRRDLERHRPATARGFLRIKTRY